ncbi:circadian clock-controlled protein [Drosophila innubila]|uniref:circadian clock-controlled protein n=1 Tax=Drosophila innubila TaxID=198719 RepID=UPI00148DD05C|nr:circadian clock-controlled protein [Drosophila innubila]
MHLMKMFKPNRVVALNLLWICGVVAEGFIPSSIKRCHLGDEACYKTQAQNYLEYYKYGIPEHNVPSIEPLKIGTLRSQIGGKDTPMQLNLLMTNTSAHHFGSSMVVKSLTIMATPDDLSKPAKTIMIMSSPLIDVTANYHLKGKFLILPIDSKGQVSIKLRQVDVNTVIDMLPEKRTDGLHYLKITGYKMTVETGSGSFNMTNLFKDPALSESTIKVFNDEYKTFSKELEPKIMEAATRATRETLQKVFDIIPFDDFFLK